MQGRFLFHKRIGKHMQNKDSNAQKRTQISLSQAAACDGTLITTSAENQEIVPGTLPTF